jgi:glutaredoxin
MELELYVREGCSRCKRVREALKSMGIEVSVVDIDAQEVVTRARALGIRSVPVLRKSGTMEMKVGDVSREELLKFVGREP